MRTTCAEKKNNKFDKENKCELVWIGMATKRQFKGFFFHHCETSAKAHKLLKSKGVGQYWDQVLAHASGRRDSLHLKLVETSDDDDGNGDDNGDDNDNENDNDKENENDVEMPEA